MEASPNYSSTVSKQLHVGEFGGDFDKIISAILSAALRNPARPQIDLLGFVVNCLPAEQRALLGKSIFKQLGTADFPVAIGSEHRQRRAREVDLSSPFSAEISELEPNGKELFLRIAASAPDKSIDLVLMSALTDAAQWLRDHPTLFTSKVRSVTMMSGVQTLNGQIVLDTEGHFSPDDAVNNTKDAEAATWLFKQLQIIGIPITVLTRHAAVVGAVSKTFFDELAKTRHPVGEWARNGEAKYERELFRQACLPKGHPERTLPWGNENDPRNEAWYRRTRCGGNTTALTATQPDVWEIVSSIPQFNSLTIMAATPKLSERFFSPTPVVISAAGGVRPPITSSASAEKNTVSLILEDYRDSFCRK